MLVSICSDSKKIEIPFDSSAIQFEKIIVDDKIMLPFSNPISLQAAMPFVKDNEKWTRPSWGCSDYENTRLWLQVDIGGSKPIINLITEIIPPRYTDDQARDLLQSASQEEREDTYSDYLSMMDMLDIARNWHADPSSIGEMYLHPAKLNDNEMGEVMYILAQALREDEIQQEKLRRKVFM